MSLPTIKLNPPFLIFNGDETRPTYAKTGAGLVEWRGEVCKGQLRLNSDAVDFGLPDMSPKEAASAGIRSLVVGVAPVGGTIPGDWLGPVCEAARAGLDIVAGLHTRLNDDAQLKEAAAEGGARLIDVRVPPPELPVGSGRKRTGRRLLTVGTDCAIGKKYTALAVERDMRRRGFKAEFRASGQTGIMIAGEGIPIDAVVSDFLSGAAEILSPDNEPDHWDIVEGQGAIFHPGYAGVSHGLLIGSQPDAIIVCHEAGRTHISGWPDFELPPIASVIDRNLEIGRLTNSDIRCVGISVNTANLAPGEREDYLKRLSAEYGLPCVDSVIDGTDAIIERIADEFGL